MFKKGDEVRLSGGRDKGNTAFVRNISACGTGIELRLKLGGFYCWNAGDLELASAVPVPELASPVQNRLEYLLREWTCTNPFGVEIKSHPELGQVDYMEACTEFVRENGPELLEMLNREPQQ